MSAPGVRVTALTTCSLVCLSNYKINSQLPSYAWETGKETGSSGAVRFVL